MPDDGIKRPWPLDTATMEADLVDLASRRPDLSDWQRTELYLSAAFRFRDLDTGDAALPEQRAIFAWIDIVSPPEARATTQKQSPMERLVRMLIGRDTDRLLVGPDPPTTAAPLAALADKRPDLSVVQRHELLIAALGSLGRMDKGRRVEATNDAIFAWINVVVPVPAPVPDDRTLGEVKRLAPSLDDLEDRIHNLRQQRRLQDHLDALEADEALETLISRPSQARSGGSIPERHTRAAKQAAASRRTEPVVGRRGADEADQSESAEEQAAAQLEASARRMIAVWAGHPKVVTLVEHLRPDFRALLDQLAIDTDDRLPAAARILGMWPIVPGGTAWPNFFLNWPAEKLAAASLIATRVRSGLAEAVTRLRAEGVRRLPPIDQVTPDADTPDGLGFGFQHLELLLMLWLDVSLADRTGSEIAADLPTVGAVGWERGRSVLLVGDASQPDILAGDTLRRAFVRRSEQEQAPEPTVETSAIYGFGDPEVQARLQTEFEPPSDPIERHKLPGWTWFAEFDYLAKHPQRRPRRRAGRPAGPYLIQTRAEIEKAYRELWTLQGRRPFWRQVALALGVDERTLRRVRRDFGLDNRPIDQTPE